MADSVTTAAPAGDAGGAAGVCWSGTRRTWTWASARSSAAGPPPPIAPGSTRWAAGCSPRTAELSAHRRRPRRPLEPEATVFANIAPGTADWYGRGSRRCATSVSRFSPSPRSTRTPTSTATCSRTSRCARGGWPASSSRRPTGRPSASRWRASARRSRGPGARLPRARELGVASDTLIHRPRGHSGCVPRTAAAGQPRLAARRRSPAAAVPAVVGAPHRPRRPATDR